MLKIHFKIGICLSSISSFKTSKSFFFPYFAEIIVYKIKITKSETNIIPLNLEITPFCDKTKNINVIIIMNGISIIFVFFENFTFLTTVVTPKISSKLHKLLPITLPNETSPKPWDADVKETKNSGIDVPIETIVRPIIISGILNE